MPALAACPALTVASALALTLPRGAAAAANGSRTPTSRGTGYAAETKTAMSRCPCHARCEVTRAHVAYTYTCNDGTTFTDFEGFRAIPLSRAGAFSSAYDSGDFPTPLLADGPPRVTGSIGGRRNKLRTKVTGTSRFTVVTMITATGEVMACDTGVIRCTAKD